MSLSSLASNLSILVRNGLDISNLGSVLATPEVVIDRDGESAIGAVERLLGVLPGVGLDEDVGSLAGVDAVRDAQKVVVIYVTGSEAEGWAAGVDVEEIVVGVGHAEMSFVLASIGVGVADQGCLPVVVEEAVGDGDEITSVGHVKKSVVIVFIVGKVG